ncbi:hypothetical protein EBZ38_08485 [bacterium]|nr:hypothetical protein [bacterium]
METKYKSLAFDPAKEAALVGHLTREKKFLAQFRHLCKPEHFIEVRHRIIVEELFRFWDLYKRVPTTAEFQSLWRAEDEANRRDILTALSMCGLRTVDFPLDTIRVELTEWVQSKQVYETLKNAAEEYNREKPDSAIKLIKEMAQTIGKMNFDADKEERFDLEEMFASRSKELEGASTFGLKVVDKLLLPESTHGGLLPGDLTVLLAPTNTGKTSTMVTIARHNLLSRNPSTGEIRKVLFLTHEGRPEDIKLKMICSLLKKSKAELDQMYATSHPFLERIAKILAENFTYVPLNEPGQTVESVASIIQMKQDEAKARWGRGYDLVIDDYPAKLTTITAKGGNMTRRNVDEYVYNYFVQMALEHKFHVVCAIQSNREGSKINRGFKGHEKRLLSMEDVLESWGPMTLATNVISLNRDPRAAAKEIMTFYICKSRSNQTGFAVAAKSNFSACITHSEEKGGVYYLSNMPMLEKVDHLLESYRGNQIPEIEVQKALAEDERAG